MNIQRCVIAIQGAVQGVGFRPFVYRIATELALNGWVSNGTQGVQIEVEGPPDKLNTFLDRLRRDAPPQAIIHHIQQTLLSPMGYQEFEIRHSSTTGDKTVFVLPDLAICADCLRELFDLYNRRYRYPFINCTHCGPRYTIITALPYDRPNTSMKHFPMCETCQSEYDHPLDRRFHAQPNACPECGPHVELWNKQGNRLATHDDAIRATVQAIRDGQIVAVKGLGGFHLIVDAHNADAINILRERKHRPAKPFALMYPTLESIESDAYLSLEETRLLNTAAAPIVLVKKRPDSILPTNIAPNNAILGIMLPYTPIHHLLLHDLGTPIIATSGNRSNEPICIDEHEALERLQDIADIFLIHNRPIHRPVDDSIVHIIDGKLVILRRARGYAPLPITLNSPLPPAVAVGAHLKNTLAMGIDHHIFSSQHLGDLESVETMTSFQRTLDDFRTLYNFSPEYIVCDSHPDYLSTQEAERIAAEKAIPLIRIQHHAAHVYAGIAEHQLVPPLLGVVWDGTGYGDDQTIWGGEFLAVDRAGYRRLAHLAPFPLIGGDAAVKEPRRIALGLGYQQFGDSVFDHTAFTKPFSLAEIHLFQTMLHKNLNTPMTSSMGRLFDGVAALLGLSQHVSFEGEAAIHLESIIDSRVTETYFFEVTENPDLGTFVIHWQPLITAILQEKAAMVSIGIIAAKFHNTLVEMIGAVAEKFGIPTVLLTGGCFQNRYLLEKAVEHLTQHGFTVHFPQQIPPNDGGIAIGQLYALYYQTKE